MIMIIKKLQLNLKQTTQTTSLGPTQSKMLLRMLPLADARTRSEEISGSQRDPLIYCTSTRKSFNIPVNPLIYKELL